MTYTTTIDTFGGQVVASYDDADINETMVAAILRDHLRAGCMAVTEAMIARAAYNEINWRQPAL